MSSISVQTETSNIMDGEKEHRFPRGMSFICVVRTGEKDKRNPSDPCVMEDDTMEYVYQLIIG